MKRIWILTVLPEYFTPFVSEGVVGQLLSGKRGDAKLELNIVNIREYGHGNHNAVDDAPFGGGPGMLLRADVLEKSLLKGVVEKGGYGDIENELTIIYTSARGEIWNSTAAKELKKNHWDDDSTRDLVFICGRYEGIDERFLNQYVNKEYCLGPFILSGGELAVMAILDSSLRFVDGTLGNSESYEEDSFENNLLDYPQYTRPAEFNNTQIPQVLLSGHHANIEKWRKEQKIKQTKKYRPEILKGTKNEK